MSEVVCFLVVETERERRWLRRYANGSTCPGRHGYHNALSPIEDGAVLRSPEGYIQPVPEDQSPGPDDSRWPTACGCGYVFAESDEWQVFHDVIYRRADTGGEWPRRELPPGAIYDAWWAFEKGADGHAWTLMLPDGVDWHIDGPSKNGGGWTRTGEAPRLTARPSILTPGYHGFLTDGVLRAC